VTRPPAPFFETLATLRIEPEAGEIDRFERFLDLLLEANTRFNLTAVTDPGDAWVRHIADSLTLLPPIVSLRAKRVMDVGSGGGLPAIPLAIALPEVQFTLLEATGKKARFLTETAEALELHNVVVINDRAEKLGQRAEHRSAYDVVTARAVGRLRVLLDWGVPFVRPGGWLLAMKGRQAQEEIKEARDLLRIKRLIVGTIQPTPTGVIVPLQKPSVPEAKGSGGRRGRGGVSGRRPPAPASGGSGRPKRRGGEGPGPARGDRPPRR
jgi:16S rRNA (guanine527-N7)-methyltransferase